VIYLTISFKFHFNTIRTNPTANFPCAIFSMCYFFLPICREGKGNYTQHSTSRFKSFGVLRRAVINVYRRFGRASVTTCQPAGCSLSEDFNSQNTAVRTLKPRTDELVSSMHTLTF